MSQFVNYQKRSISLPAGCKDLIDLLRLKTPSKPHGKLDPNQQPDVTRGGFVVGKVADVARFVPMLFHSPPQILTLMMSSPDEHLTFVLSPEDRGIAAVAVFPHDPELDAALRAFFDRHDLQPPRSCGSEDHPQSFHHLYPLPSEAALLSGLVTDFFREICEFGNESDLHFRYYEAGTPPKP